MHILVLTCAKYSQQVIPAFARAFARAWPACPWPIHLLHSGELQSYDHVPGDWNIHITNDTGWASSLLTYLRSLETPEPFLLLLDDYILDAVDYWVLKTAALLFDDSLVGMVRIHPVPGPTLPFRDYRGFGMIDKQEPYAVSFQPAMWRPQVLIDLLRPDEDAWQSEINGSARAMAYDRFEFISTMHSALGYRNLMRRGVEQPDVRAWIDAHIADPQAA